MQNQLINSSQLSNKSLTIVNSYLNVSTTPEKINTKIPIFVLICFTFNKQSLLVSGDQIGRLIIFKTNQVFVKIKEINAHSHRIRSLTVINSKKGIIASASQGKLTTIRIWDISTGIALATLKGHIQTVSSLIELNNGMQIGSASYDGTIKIWRWDSQTLLHDISAHGFPILSLIKSNQNQKIIISGADDYKIKIWQYQTETCLNILDAHQGYVQSLIWLGNNKFASGAANGQIYFWNVDNIKKNQVEPEKKVKVHKQNITGLHYMQEKKLLISVSEDMSLIVLDLINMKIFVKKQAVHSNTITALAVDDHDNKIFTAGWDGYILEYLVQI